MRFRKTRLIQEKKVASGLQVISVTLIKIEPSWSAFAFANVFEKEVYQKLFFVGLVVKQI